MKKFLLLLLMPFMFMACKNATPEFGFKLNVTGEVHDTATNISSNFIGDVTNLNDYETMQLQRKDVSFESVVENMEVNSWVNNQAMQMISMNITESTTYTVRITGTVFERHTGLMFSVDKTFTNDTIQ